MTSSALALTDQESTLRRLLLDVAQYVGSLNGHKTPQLRFTGGWVRDKLLGSESHDIDIGIDSLTGVQFGDHMKNYLNHADSRSRYPSGVLGALAKIEANPEKSKHLETVTTKIFGLEIDLVNLRKETYTEESRNPAMEFGSPEEDALRRDATVNALFYNLSSGKVEDLTGRGLQDLDRKVIKTPLRPLQTFKDDPLRVLRAIRFASRLGFEIDKDDMAAMKDSSIKEALRIKISRERIGVEVVKMLQGSNPHMALSLLNATGLYGTIFTDNCSHAFVGGTVNTWSKAYDQLQILSAGDSPTAVDSTSSLRQIRKLLVRNSNDKFLAWLLVCFVPWARVPLRSKKGGCPASAAAREGMKADNKLCKIVEDAARHLDSVILTKVAVNQPKSGNGVDSEGSNLLIGRDTQGLTIRKWGSHWRCCVTFALLVEISEATNRIEMDRVIVQYATWLEEIRSLDLLDAPDLKPIVNGKHLLKAFPGQKSGPWMTKALEIAMAWQLRNPGVSEPDGAIAEVVRRKHDISIP